MGLLLSPGIPDPGAKIVASHSWAGSTALPGQYEFSNRGDMTPFAISGNRIQENPAGGASTPAFWFVGHPTAMATRTYTATVTVGNQSSGTNRGCLAFVGGNNGAGTGVDGTDTCVWFRIRGQSTAVVIGTKVGTTITDRVSGANGIVSAGDTIGLEITVSGGIYTYQGYKNGVIIPSAVWTDTTAIAGIPGHIWGGGGYGIYSGSYFPSLGVYGIAGADT